MFRSRDFYLVKVYDLKGKCLGIVNDISIDFYNGLVKGLTISGSSILKRSNYIEVDDIVSFQECIIVKDIKKANIKEMLTFKEIKYMDIVNSENIMIGVLEDLMIDTKTFAIKAFIMSSGLFDKMVKGKEIINIKSTLLCDNYILYCGGSSVRFQTLPHNIGGSKNV